MAGYNIIVKAETAEDVNEYVEDWLSIPRSTITNAGSLGYDEVMVSIQTDVDLHAGLAEWHNEMRPESGPFPLGALIWWKSDSAESGPR